MPFDVVTCLSKPALLAEEIRGLAEKRSRRLDNTPKWAKQVLAKPGFRHSVAGFIANRISKGQFDLGSGEVKPNVRRKFADPFQRDFISEDAYQQLSDDPEDEKNSKQYRRTFSLQFPDMLLHALVGRFLREKLENILHTSCQLYRPGKDQASAVQLVRSFMANGESWIVKLDVSDFNGTADHQAMQRIVGKFLCPILNDDERRITEGTLQALYALSGIAYDIPGRGLLVGSGLTPALTNLYLHPLDCLLEAERLPWVRCGDDLVAFCPSESAAESLLRKLVSTLAELQQKPSETPVFSPEHVWWRGFAVTYGLKDRDKLLIYQRIREKASLGLKKTGVLPPTASLDFIGFEFIKDRVCIRQSTLFKVYKRIERYTQRYRSEIERSEVERYGEDWGMIVKVGSREEAWVSIRYLQRAVQRLNTLMGFRTPWPKVPPPYRIKPQFQPRAGFTPNVLRCAPYEFVADQLRALDGYVLARIGRLIPNAGSLAIAKGSPSERWYDWDGMSLRGMGLRSSGDVAKRMDPKYFPNNPMSNSSP